MGRRDDGHNGDMRAGHFGQGRDFTGVVHADLDHREIGVGGHAGQCQRHAPMVVIAGFGGVGLALPRQNGPQHFLGRGFADRPGDRHDLGLGPRAGGTAQILKTCQNIIHQQKRRIVSDAFGNATDQCSASAVFQGLRNKIVAVTSGLQGHKQIALFYGTRVDGNAIHGPIADGFAFGCRCGLGCGPECHASFPSSAATATLACSASSNG